MKLASTVARYLLGLMFTVFGANGFLHFIKQPPPSSPQALQFFGLVVGTHFMVIIFLLQLVAGILLLADLYAAFALVILAAILVNILNFHITMDPGGIGLGIVATVLWLIAAVNYRANFQGILAPKSAAATAPRAAVRTAAAPQG